MITYIFINWSIIIHFSTNWSLGASEMTTVKATRTREKKKPTGLMSKIKRPAHVRHAFAFWGYSELCLVVLSRNDHNKGLWGTWVHERELSFLSSTFAFPTKLVIGGVLRLSLHKHRQAMRAWAILWNVDKTGRSEKMVEWWVIYLWCFSFFELFCVNKIALCQHEAQEILPWSDEWMVWVLPWTNEVKVTLDGIVSARGQPHSLF